VPKYMVVGSYTSESWARMVDNPSDRTAAARAACEAAGGSLEAFYWAFGPDDFVAIADVPDDAGAAAISVGISGSGAVQGVRTIKLLTADESQTMLQRAKVVASGYRRPGT
jgi:uncharacterized protein with GYD domain